MWYDLTETTTSRQIGQLIPGLDRGPGFACAKTSHRFRQKTPHMPGVFEEFLLFSECSYTDCKGGEWHEMDKTGQRSRRWSRTGSQGWSQRGRTRRPLCLPQLRSQSQAYGRPTVLRDRVSQVRQPDDARIVTRSEAPFSLAGIGSDRENGGKSLQDRWAVRRRRRDV
jgi:hypothetical protein